MRSAADMGPILVVVPTYNERGNVERLCSAILDQGERVEVLVVDDNSPDGTGEVAESLTRVEPRVHLLRRRGKLGLGTAHVAGLRWALERDYELVVTMDADFSHPPDRIPEMLARTSDCDVVIGSRYVPGGGCENWPLRRVLLSRLSNWVARTLLRLEPRDCTGAFRCFRREALACIPMQNIRARGYSFMEEMLWQCSGRGWRFGEVPIDFVDRTEGESKISISEVLAAVLTVFRLVFTPEGQKRSHRC
jgi:dolichol-phosphate mannosyltransferase